MAKIKHINEATTVYTDRDKIEKHNKRVTKIWRLTQEAREAAKKARATGREKEAVELEATAQQLEDWAEGLLDSEIDPNKNNMQTPNNSASSTESDSSSADQNDSNEQEQPEEFDDEDNSVDNSEDKDDSSDDKSDNENEDNSDADKEEEEGSGDEDKDSEAKDDEDSGNKDEDIDDSENKDSEDEDSENDAEDDLEDEDSDDKDSESSTNGNEDEDDSADSEDGSNAEDDQEPFQNPFDISPKNAQQVESDATEEDKELTHEEELAAVKKVLRMLRKGEHDGAIAGLKDLLNQDNNTNESLQEAIQISSTIDDISDDEFADILNNLTDQINAVSPVDLSIDKAAKVEKIRKTMNSPVTQKALNKEDKENKLVDLSPAEKQAYDKELNKYRVNQIPKNMNDFVEDLYYAVSNQVDRFLKSHETWSQPNRRYSNTDIIKKGTTTSHEWGEGEPLIYMYLDCSGSFDKDDIQKERALLGVLNDFVEQKLVTIKLRYFAINIWDTYESARNEGGTSAWDDMLEEIKKDQPLNVIVVTDSDMNSQARWGDTVSIPGCVWYLWKGYSSPEMPKHLTGDELTAEYKITW